MISSKSLENDRMRFEQAKNLRQGLLTQLTVTPWDLYEHAWKSLVLWLGLPGLAATEVVNHFKLIIRLEYLVVVGEVND